MTSTATTQPYQLAKHHTLYKSEEKKQTGSTTSQSLKQVSIEAKNASIELNANSTMRRTDRHINYEINENSSHPVTIKNRSQSTVRHQLQLNLENATLTQNLNYNNKTSIENTLPRGLVSKNSLKLGAACDTKTTVAAGTMKTVHKYGPYCEYKTKLRHAESKTELSLSQSVNINRIGGGIDTKRTPNNTLAVTISLECAFVLGGEARLKFELPAFLMFP